MNWNENVLRSAALLRRETNRKCQDDLLLYLSRCKRKDIKTNGRYTASENWNSVDGHTGGVYVENIICLSKILAALVSLFSLKLSPCLRTSF